jgi:hypothetical protein
MNWDPKFASRSPMFTPLARYGFALAGHDWPTLDFLQDLISANRVRNARAMPLRLVRAVPQTESYEERIYSRAELPVRERNWHDLFNVLVWLTYPCAKAALNERHYHALRAADGVAGVAPTAGRGRVRDALTVFDEHGAIVTSAEPELIDYLRAFQWKQLFRGARERVKKSMRVYIFGHALYEKALNPYIGMTAHACTFVVDDDFNSMRLEQQLARVDGMVAERLRSTDAFATPQALAPLPVLGIPGWWAANDDAAFYDNAEYFRDGRMRRQ